MNRISMACNNLSIGQAIRFTRREFWNAFPDNPFTDEPGMARFKSSLIGMAYNAFDVSVDPITGDVTVTRQSPLSTGDKVFYVDWDRRHLYEGDEIKGFTPIPERVERYLRSRRR